MKYIYCVKHKKKKYSLIKDSYRNKLLGNPTKSSYLSLHKYLSSKSDIYIPLLFLAWHNGMYSDRN